jgi:dihydroorotate dehydrogenase
MLEIGNVVFAHRAFNASGANGFFGLGNEYWFHPIAKPFGLGFRNTNFVTKTATADRLIGNMPLGGKRGVTPQEWFPRCIWFDHLRAAALNVVGLSNPGLPALLAAGYWQQRTEPFLISVMAVGGTRQERLEEYDRLGNILRRAVIGLRTRFGVEANFSCPNTKHDPAELVGEVQQCIDVLAGKLRCDSVPIVVKLNALVGAETVCRIAAHPDVAAICGTNTIPYGQLPLDIEWHTLFGSSDPAASPLTHRGMPGPGGLSGRPIARVARRWVRSLHDAGISKPVIGGGGVLSVNDAFAMIDAGAAGVFVGSACFLRPTRVQGLMDAINAGFGD